MRNCNFFVRLFKFLITWLSVFVQIVYSKNDTFFFYEATVSLENEFESKCLQHLGAVFQHISEDWAMKMIDASSKIESGILQGNLANFGSFDQCLSVEHKINNDTIKGNYCKASFPIAKILKWFFREGNTSDQMWLKSNMDFSKLALTSAFCVPNSCDVDDLNRLIKQTPVIKNFNFTFLNCQSQTQQLLATGDVAVITFFVVILIVLCLSTVFDLLTPMNNRGRTKTLLCTFSVCANGQKLFATSKNSNQLQCLQGIKCITMIWIILAHTYHAALFSPSFNSRYMVTWLQKLSSMYISGATVSVDTFFTIGGLLLSYIYLSAIDNGIRLNIFYFYLHRYLRLTPSLIAVLLFHISIVRFLGSGPYWPEVMKLLEENCSKYWWSTLLYIQNFVNPKEVCIIQSWYLSVDMQIYIFSPVALIPLGKWPKITIPILIFFIFVSVANSFMAAWVNKIPGFAPNAFMHDTVLTTYYYNTSTRFGPTVVGIVLGYVIYTKKKHEAFNSVVRNKYFRIAGWLIALLSMLLIVFVPHNLSLHKYNRWESSTFIAVHRVAWSLAVSWIIYICVLGYGGIVNKFLSLPIFQVLSKLTYTMYLTHNTLIWIKTGRSRIPEYFSDFQNVYNFWANMALTVIISIIWTLAFESPIIAIEKLVFKKLR